MSYQEEKLTEIANAIREKKQTSEPIKAIDFADEILSITGSENLDDVLGEQDNDLGNLETEVEDLNDRPETMDWNWGKQVCENDVQDGFTYKVLQMIDDGYPYTDIIVPIGGAVKTSDGGYYTSDAKHTWNDTNAKESYSTPGVKLRWLIYYYTDANANIVLLNYVKYACFDGMQFGDIFQRKSFLEYFDLINGADLNQSITSLHRFFQYCINLKKVPLFNTASVDDISSLFIGCLSLIDVPNFDFSSVQTATNMFDSCVRLKTIPKFKFLNLKNIAQMFNFTGIKKITDADLAMLNLVNLYETFTNCYYLETVDALSQNNMLEFASGFVNCTSLKSVKLNTTNVVVMNFIGAFTDCYNLRELYLTKVFDYTTAETPGGALKLPYKLTNLTDLKIDSIECGLDISCSTKYSQETLETLIDNLIDLTDKTQQKFIMGTENLAKVSQEKKDLATAKNWVLE